MLKMAKRTWSDQPAALDSCDILCSVRCYDATHGEVRRRFVGGDGPARLGLAEQRPAEYYVTIGNLFQSQTIKCDDTDAVFRALNEVSKGKKSLNLPEGCELMSNG